jgi:hypothetical protein
MRITNDQIRKALVAIAELKNRPHYEMSVVREVIDAINLNSHHRLKTLTLQEIYTQYGNRGILLTEDKPFDPEACVLKITEVKAYYAGQKALVTRSGVSERTISLILSNKQKLTQKMWRKIEPVIDEVLSDLKRYNEEKEKKSHGNYVTYRKGCRCDDCKIGWRNYINSKKISIEKAAT